VLLTLSMPGFNVPLLIVLLTAQARHVFPLALPFGLVF
jgi:hypothetical protein